MNDITCHEDTPNQPTTQISTSATLDAETSDKLGLSDVHSIENAEQASFELTQLSLSIDIKPLCEPYAKTEFDPHFWIEEFTQACSIGKRFPYNIITNWIYNLSSEQAEVVVSNLSKTAQIFNNNLESSALVSFNKFSDHIKLAISQKTWYETHFEDKLRAQVQEQSEILSDDFKKKLELAMQDKTSEFQDKLQEATTKTTAEFQQIIQKDISASQDKITAQLVSLVAIFTALSFVMFGAISSLDSIFSYLQNTGTIITTLIVSMCWAFCSINLLFLFLYFVLKIVRPTDFSGKISTLFFHRYPFFVILNFIILTLLLIFIWVYIISTFELASSLPPTQ